MTALLAVVLLALATTVAVAPVARADSSRPVVTDVPDVLPSYGGDFVISGLHLSDPEPRAYVGSHRIRVGDWDTHHLHVTFPPAAPGSYHVRVVTHGGTSELTRDDVVTYRARPWRPWNPGDPVILQIAPMPTIANQVYVRGRNLGAVDTIMFGGQRVTSFEKRTSDSIRVALPSGLPRPATVRAYVGQDPSPDVNLYGRDGVLRPGVKGVPAVTPSGGGPATVFAGNAFVVTAAVVGGTRVPAHWDWHFRRLDIVLPPHAPGAFHVRLATPYAESNVVDADVTYYTAKTTSRWTSGAGFDNRAGVVADESCPADDFCSAVDDHRVANFDGTSWATPQTFPGSARLTGISCVSAAFCVAVDRAGRAWTRRDGAWDGGATVSAEPLVDVSCPSTSSCTAIDGTNAYRFDGTSWSEPAVIDRYAAAYTVSCPTAQFCMSGGARGMAESHGSTWTVDPVNAGYVYSVDCVSEHFCGVIDGDGEPLLYRDGSWSRYYLGTPVEAISCRAAENCIAVDGGHLAFAWDGSAWSSPVDVEPGRSESGLDRIECATTWCFAADSAGRVFGYSTGPWSDPVAVFEPHGPASSTSCPSVSFCATVDMGGGVTFHDADRERSHSSVDPGPLAQRSISCATTTFCALVGRSGHVSTWNGHRWTAPASVTTADLSSVSCPSATFCMAVAVAGPAARWDGHEWSAVATPGDGPAGGPVSCASADFCLATRMRWDGAHWLTTAGPDHVFSLSCPSVEFCMASVDDVATLWRSGSWVATRMPGYEVACASAASCSVANRAYPNATSMRSWNGSVWSDGVTIDGYVTTLACPAADSCIAVADDHYASGVPR